MQVLFYPQFSALSVLRNFGVFLKSGLLLESGFHTSQQIAQGVAERTPLQGIESSTYSTCDSKISLYPSTNKTLVLDKEYVQQVFKGIFIVQWFQIYRKVVNSLLPYTQFPVLSNISVGLLSLLTNQYVCIIN